MAAGNSSIGPSPPTTWPPRLARPGQGGHPGRGRRPAGRFAQPTAHQRRSPPAAAHQERPRALAVMRHSAAHVMAQAVMRLFEGVQLAFGPTTATGFYYDFHLPHPLSEEDFPRIEAEMQKIVKADERFERLDMPRDEAIALCRELEPGIQSRAHRNRPRRREVAVVLSPGRVHRSVPRQAHPQHRPHRRRVQAALRGRRVLERRRRSRSSCSASTPPRSSTRKSSTPISSNWPKPSAAITACSASSSSCSPSAKPSAPA